MVNVGERNTPSSRRDTEALLAAGSVSKASTGRFGSPTTKSPAGLGALPKASSSTAHPAKSWPEKSPKVSGSQQSEPGAAWLVFGRLLITDWILSLREPDSLRAAKVVNLV